MDANKRSGVCVCKGENYSCQLTVRWFNYRRCNISVGSVSGQGREKSSGMVLKDYKANAFSLEFAALLLLLLQNKILSSYGNFRIAT